MTASGVLGLCKHVAAAAEDVAPDSDPHAVQIAINGQPLRARCLKVKLKDYPQETWERQKFKNTDSDAMFASLLYTLTPSYSRRTPTTLKCACTPMPYATS